MCLVLQQLAMLLQQLKYHMCDFHHEMEMTGPSSHLAFSRLLVFF
jgi:hypothetical protein